MAADDRLAAKAPRLERLDDFACEQLGADRFDWVLAFSVLNHCDDATRRAFFDRVPAVLAPHATVVVTHADWFDESLLHGGRLAMARMLPCGEVASLVIREGKMFPVAVMQTQAAHALAR